MSARNLGRELVRLCREGKNLDVVQAHYADDVESIEAAATGGYDRVTRGKQAVLDKNVKWGDEHEIHRADAEGPYPHGDDRFAVRFSYDITRRADGARMKFDEVAVFTVRNGKIAREEFFYDVGG